MKVLVVGCGSIGQKYIQWLKDLNVDVIACDNDVEKLEEVSKFNIQSFSELKRALDEKPGRVIVATPPNYHLEPAILSAEIGADVLVEKPLSSSLNDVQVMQEASKKYAVQIYGVCNMRFHPAIQAIRSNLGKIGKPLCVRAYFSHRLSQMRPAGLAVYAADERQGGGVILDCIHELDYIHWMLGSTRKIRSLKGRIGPDPIEADDIAEIQFELNSGAYGTVHFDFLSKLKRRGLEIIGENASIFWQSEGRKPEQCKVTLGGDGWLETVIDIDSVDPVQPYKAMLTEFLGAPEDARNLQTLEDGGEVLKTALLAHHSTWSEL